MYQHFFHLCISINPGKMEFVRLTSIPEDETVLKNRGLGEGVDIPERQSPTQRLSVSSSKKESFLPRFLRNISQQDSASSLVPLSTKSDRRQIRGERLYCGKYIIDFKGSTLIQ